MKKGSVWLFEWLIMLVVGGRRGCDVTKQCDGFSVCRNGKSDKDAHHIISSYTKLAFSPVQMESRPRLHAILPQPPTCLYLCCRKGIWRNPLFCSSYTIPKYLQENPRYLSCSRYSLDRMCRCYKKSVVKLTSLKCLVNRWQFTAPTDAVVGRQTHMTPTKCVISHITFAWMSYIYGTHFTQFAACSTLLPPHIYLPLSS